MTGRGKEGFEVDTDITVCNAWRQKAESDEPPEIRKRDHERRQLYPYLLELTLTKVTH